MIVEETNQPLTVSDVNRFIKSILSSQKDLKNIWVKGEISNFTRSGNGHIYFSLKDPSSLIRCTFFSYSNQYYKGKPLKDGLEVQVLGSISVYEPGGTYSINVTKVEELGKGDILYQIEQLKQKLYTLGIFDPKRKKPLPKLPKTLGIVTSPHGAAIEDIIRIAQNRYPNINILIAPCSVQGEEATSSIINAISELNNPLWDVDVIIAGRGGGSFEDLMAFNQEDVVMAYYNSNVPIVSAVGHQIDSVLSDLAADHFSPTPTAAAEDVIPDIQEYELYLEGVGERLDQSLKFKLKINQDRFGLISNKRVFTEPETMLMDRYQKVDETINRIFLLGKNYISAKRQNLQQFEKLSFLIKGVMQNKKGGFEVASERIENFSPLLTLKRGYSVVRDLQKKVITSYKQVQKGQELEVILSEGKFLAEVKESIRVD
ncbi:MAG: exodeoxyribonuclease VII large subunit [Leptospiraceae bacterium]|nr:exodeoxyribonuclease VII large subunit [Leptospiraceae bacterium]MCP5497259.1 exodeoxyribonuclease VII large subunit [Leptospiraceae bacterium]